MSNGLIVIGGLGCGFIAGAAAQYGRLCTMGAIEDLLIGRDTRGIKAWGLALAVAIALTQAGVASGLIDLSGAGYLSPSLDVIAVVAGGLLFGLGMSLAGTCSFGLLVRTGAGDLRAGIAALIVGIFAFAVTAGALSWLRTGLLGHVEFGGETGATLPGLTGLSPDGAAVFIAALAIALAAGLPALFDARLRKRPRLLGAGVLIGASIAAGWWITSSAVAELELSRPESLSFVAPTGRMLLQFMIEPLKEAGFGVATIAGVVAGSAMVALARGEARWEAYDDAREMRRHLAGAALMGIGGVLARGCTIGQGLSAASALAVSAPLFLLAVLLGARLGLAYLIEGRWLWPGASSHHSAANSRSE